jgi:SAM-dependent methyltransferase
MDQFRALGSEHYDHHGLNTVEDRVQERYLSNSAEMERTSHLVGLVPPGVETLLDVGAGYGIFLHELTQLRDIQVEGVDVSDNCMSWGRARGLKLSLASAHELPFEDRQFQMITCSEVMEHLTWGVYEQALTELSRVAESWILMSVPYDEKRGYAKCPYCGASVNPNYHMRSFAPEDLEGLFPGFHLKLVDTICELSIVTMLKQYLPLPWESDLICPACNYRHTDTGSHRKSSRMTSLKNVLRSLPMPRRPRWLVGLFERD